MRQRAFLLAGLTALAAGAVVMSFANTTKTEMRWALAHLANPTGRLATAALVFALSLTPLGFLVESTGDQERTGPSLPAYSLDGAWMAFTSDRTGEDELYVARLGGAARRITRTLDGVTSPAWSPDGSKLVFGRRTGNEWPERAISGLFVVSRDGGTLRQLTSGEDSWPCWTSDGETVVFARGNQIRAVSADGTGGRRLVRNADMPACSPIEPTIAFVAQGRDWVGSGIDIGILDLRTGRRSVLPNPGDVTDYAWPAWSPDGRRIVFEAQRSRVPTDPVIEEGPWAVPWYFAELYVVDSDGSRLVRLTDNGVGDRWPLWTPEGRIVFVSNRAGPDDLANSEASDCFVMSADGTHVERFPWDPSYS